MRYIYKSDTGFVFTTTPLPEPLEEGMTPSSEEEYQIAMATRKAEIDTIMSLPINVKRREIEELKRDLSLSDYKAIKYAEGAISEEDYLPIKLERQQKRDRINQLEEEIRQLDD